MNFNPVNFSLPWKNYTYVGFDTETSGKYPLVAEVVELAAVKWLNGRVIETFESFVRPSRPMGEAVINIHHITNEMVANAPSMDDVLPRFDAFIKDSILIAHHAPFDMGFLSLEYERLKIPLPQSRAICSCLLSRKVFPHATNHRLATLVSMFGIQVAAAHRALDDSRACLEVAMRCMEKLGAEATLDFVLAMQGGALEWNRFAMSDLELVDKTRVLVEGSRRQLVLEITYKGGTKPGEPRRITPQGLVRNPEGDYVVGLCHIDNIEKRFYLNRILTAKILD